MKANERDLDAVVGACRRLGVDPAVCTDLASLRANLAARRAQSPDLAALAELLSARLQHLSEAAMQEIRRKLS
jgi:hypothetical protein